jgi:hypothetical protein
MSNVRASILIADGVILSLMWNDPGWRFREWEDVRSPALVLVPVDDLDRERCFESIEKAHTFFFAKYRHTFAARRQILMPGPSENRI